MYACKIQNWKFGSVLTTAYLADPRKKPTAKFFNNADYSLSVAEKIKIIQNVRQSEHQSCNQLGTPGGAKIFLRGAQTF